ncbi:MAG: CRISPR-associated ring nuclease Csm6 [Gammaproteobacteria bacterium]
MEPQEYPRRILVAVTGLSPQVVTETLYALAVKPEDRHPFLPTDVYLITTNTGGQHARLNLLSDEPGWFHRLRRDYALPEIAFSPDHILVVPGTDGEPLDDIRTPADNERTADFITDQIRVMTGQNTAALHVSIAGGRKTMGYYLGYALSLFGRPQDRLSHVLVSPPFESHPEFYYPTPSERVIHTLDRQQLALNCHNANVELADIPFVRLRDDLPKGLVDGKLRFSEVVAEAQKALPPIELVLDPAARKVMAGGESVGLKRADFAFYWWAAERRRQGLPGVHWSENGIERELLAHYAQLVGRHSGEYVKAEEAYAIGFTKENFDPRKAHINKALEQTLGHRRAQPYLLAPLERIPRTRYRRFGLTLPAEAIRIV